MYIFISLQKNGLLAYYTVSQDTSASFSGMTITHEFFKRPIISNIEKLEGAINGK